MTQKYAMKQAPIYFPNGVYPYDDGEDQYVVILDCAEVAWTGTLKEARRLYKRTLRLAIREYRYQPTVIRECDDYGLPARG